MCLFLYGDYDGATLNLFLGGEKKKRGTHKKKSLSFFDIFFLLPPGSSNLRLPEALLLRGLHPLRSRDREHRQVLLPVDGEPELRGPRIKGDGGDSQAPPPRDNGDDGERDPDRQHEEEDSESAEQALDDPVGPQGAQKEDGGEDSPQREHELVAAGEEVRGRDARRGRAVPDAGLLEDAKEGESHPEGAVGGEGGGAKGVSCAHLPLAFVFLSFFFKKRGGREGEEEKNKGKRVSDDEVKKKKSFRALIFLSYFHPPLLKIKKKKKKKATHRPGAGRAPRMPSRRRRRGRGWAAPR